MPRAPENAITISAPFGGLYLTGGTIGDVPAKHATAALNCITHDGVIEPRPGTLLYPATGQFVGACMAMKSIFIGGAARKLVCYSDAGGQSRICLVNESGTISTVERSVFALNPNQLSIVRWNDRAFVFAGEPAFSMKLYTNTQSSTIKSARIGILAPSAPSLSVAGTGLTGTFSYRLTYYNENTGTESPPSAATSTTVANQTIYLSWVASTDTQVSHVRIYRKKDTVDATWYLFYSMPIGTVTLYDDASITIDGSAANAIDLSTSQLPVTTKAAVWRGRMWFVDESIANVDRGIDVGYTPFNKPEVWNGLDGYRCGDDRDDGVICLFPTTNALLVLKKRSVWSITGYDPSTFAAQRIMSGVGCLAAWSTVEHEGVVYWASERGVYAFDGQSVENIADPADMTRSRIGPLSDLTNVADVPFITGAFDPTTDSYVLNVRDSVTGNFARQYTYDPKTQAWQQWNIPCTAIAQHEYRTNNLRLWVANYDSGAAGHLQVSALGNYSTDADVYTEWNTTPVSFNWTTGSVTGGTRRRKKWYYAAVYYAATGDPVTMALTVDSVVDYERTGIPTARNILATTAAARIQTRMAQRGTVGQVYFASSGASPVPIKVSAIEVQAGVMQWR